MLKIEANMKSVSDIMRGYFDEEDSIVEVPRPNTQTSKMLSESRVLPVYPRKSRWSYLKEPHQMLCAKFKFKSADTYSYFLSEIADLEKRLGHHGKLECEYPDINISVRTHSLDMVTKQDTKYAKEVLKIFKDAKKLEETK